FNPQLIPHLVSHLEAPELYQCLTVSWLWFKHASTKLYSAVEFSQMSGERLKHFLEALQASVLTPQGQRSTLLDYASMVESLSIANIVFDEPSPLPSWSSVRDALALVGPSLQRLNLVIGDDSFLDLPASHTFLHSHVQFTKLKHLQVSSKCMNLPETLLLELLRSSPLNGLESIRFPRCLYNFSATGWYLVTERGGMALKDLELTPSIGPNMLGWDEMAYVNGLENVAKACTNLERLDLSGHALGINPKLLTLFLECLPFLRHVYLPAGLDDSHLITLLTSELWEDLHSLGLTDPHNMPANKFSDNMLLALLDTMDQKLKLAKTVRVYLPGQVLQVKSGKKVSFEQWLQNAGIPTVDGVGIRGKLRI
ncbi:hypothetical protein EDD86DRAFT_175375, partial [Gorgonomyces haynaldii]